MFTQSATKDGGALASWRMEAPPSDCVNIIAVRAQGSVSSYKRYTSVITIISNSFPSLCVSPFRYKYPKSASIPVAVWYSP